MTLNGVHTLPNVREGCAGLQLTDGLVKVGDIIHCVVGNDPCSGVWLVVKDCQVRGANHSIKVMKLTGGHLAYYPPGAVNQCSVAPGSAWHIAKVQA